MLFRSTSGVLAAARLPLATTTTAGGVIVPVSGGLSVDGSGNIAATFATTAQAQDLTATNVAMNPANVFSSLKAWRRVIFTSTFTASGGSATIRNEGPISLLSGTTANGACSVYHIAPFAGYSSTRYQQNPDWSRQVVLYARVLRQQASTNGVMRYLFGATAASGFA